MRRSIEIRVYADQLNNLDYHRELIARELKQSINNIEDWRIVRRSIDGRGRRPKFVLRVEVQLKGEIPEWSEEPSTAYLPVNTQKSKRVLIVGAGPAGYYAALRCIELGMEPVVIERGKDVRQRRRDLREIQQFHKVNPDSNYCFGEGGAGTYSDGKLYTRANKRGNIKKMLKILVDHGANPDIMIDAHPHIGSNKLPKIIANIRATIEQYGGQVLFNSRVVDFLATSGRVEGVMLDNEKEIRGDAVILATGHSARDIYHQCVDRGIAVEFKPFAIGVRIEHPQSLIDSIQYNQKKREENLPAASYGMACQVDGQGVFSFCMCPGGLIVPAATAPGELVVNGMSLSRRDSPFANAGTVVAIDDNPYPDSPLGGMMYQSEIERTIFNHGDGSQQAPAQRLTDFVEGRTAGDVGETSYIPGIYHAPMHAILPTWISDALREGVGHFDKKMKGYYTEEAHIIGLESRTSAPVRIPRDPITLMSDSMIGLFPCGEGAGYAGGILSAALDGQRVATAIHEFLSA